MIFIKKTLPLIITFVTGMIMIIAFFSGEGTKIKTLEEILPIWIQIIMTFTMVLGSISLLRINIQKINRKADGWGYSVVLLVGFFVMAFLGFVGGSFGNDYSFNSTPMGYYLVSDDGLSSKTVTVIDGNKDQNGLITPTKEGKVIISFKDNEGKDIQKTVSADQVKTRTMATLKNLEMFMFNGIFKSAQSTMFSLLAFFVASASFRAFRIKSKEAGLLMFSAFIVMLGNVPIGNIFGDYINIAAIKEWLMTYPSSAAQSAILIGAMLGYITSSMKIILGIERSHLGGD